MKVARPWARWVIKALALLPGLFLATCLLAGPALADETSSVAEDLLEVRLGAALHDVDGMWSGSSDEEGVDVCAELVLNRPLWQLLGGSFYPNAGLSVNTSGDTSKLYGGVLLMWEPTDWLFFSVGANLAVHNGYRDVPSSKGKALGSTLLFRLPIELGLAFGRHHRIMVFFDHISNAGLATPNEGMDGLGLMYGYRF